MTDKAQTQTQTLTRSTRARKRVRYAEPEDSDSDSPPPRKRRDTRQSRDRKTVRYAEPEESDPEFDTPRSRKRRNTQKTMANNREPIRPDFRVIVNTALRLEQLDKFRHKTAGLKVMADGIKAISNQAWTEVEIYTNTADQNRTSTTWTVWKKSQIISCVLAFAASYVKTIKEFMEEAPEGQKVVTIIEADEAFPGHYALVLEDKDGETEVWTKKLLNPTEPDEEILPLIENLLTLGHSAVGRRIVTQSSARLLAWATRDSQTLVLGEESPVDGTDGSVDDRDDDSPSEL